jgi:hypothetical protein
LVKVAKPARKVDQRGELHRPQRCGQKRVAEAHRLDDGIMLHPPGRQQSQERYFTGTTQRQTRPRLGRHASSGVEKR